MKEQDLEDKILRMLEQGEISSDVARDLLNGAKESRNLGVGQEVEQQELITKSKPKTRKSHKLRNILVTTAFLGALVTGGWFLKDNIVKYLDSKKLSLKERILGEWVVKRNEGRRTAESKSFTFTFSEDSVIRELVYEHGHKNHVEIYNDKYTLNGSKLHIEDNRGLKPTTEMKSYVSFKKDTLVLDRGDLKFFLVRKSEQDEQTKQDKLKQEKSKQIAKNLPLKERVLGTWILEREEGLPEEFKLKESFISFSSEFLNTALVHFSDGTFSEDTMSYYIKDSKLHAMYVYKGKERGFIADISLKNDTFVLETEGITNYFTRGYKEYVKFNHGQKTRIKIYKNKEKSKQVARDLPLKERVLGTWMLKKAKESGKTRMVAELGDTNLVIFSPDSFSIYEYSLGKGASSGYKIKNSKFYFKNEKTGELEEPPIDIYFKKDTLIMEGVDENIRTAMFLVRTDKKPRLREYARKKIEKEEKEKYEKKAEKEKKKAKKKIEKKIEEHKYEESEPKYEPEPKLRFFEIGEWVRSEGLEFKVNNARVKWHDMGGKGTFENSLLLVNITVKSLKADATCNLLYTKLITGGGNVYEPEVSYRHYGGKSSENMYWDAYNTKKGYFTFAGPGFKQNRIIPYDIDENSEGCGIQLIVDDGSARVNLGNLPENLGDKLNR